MSFAEGTAIPIERSKAEIESMLVRYGAEQFVSGWGETEARIQFRAKGLLERSATYTSTMIVFRVTDAGKALVMG